MRTLGWGKSSIEEKIKEECHIVLASLQATEGKPYNPDRLIAVSVANIICSMLFGERYDHDDDEFKSFIEAIDNVLLAIEECGPAVYVPWLRFFVKEADQTRRTCGKKLIDFYQKKVDEAKEKIASGNCDGNDFVSQYVMELQKSGKEVPRITQDWTHQLVNDFFGAGSETTATTMKWAILFMAMNPAVQRKVQQELDEVFGEGSHEFCLADKAKLPYTEATLHEIQRHGSIAPLGIPHEALKDVDLGGYRIPKGTAVHINLVTILLPYILFYK